MAKILDRETFVAEEVALLVEAGLTTELATTISNTKYDNLVRKMEEKEKQDELDRLAAIKKKEDELKEIKEIAESLDLPFNPNTTRFAITSRTIVETKDGVETEVGVRPIKVRLYFTVGESSCEISTLLKKNDNNEYDYSVEIASAKTMLYKTLISAYTA